MSVADLRLSLIDKIMHMEEQALLHAKALLDNEDNDWWDELSKKEQNEIEEGLVQADQGEYIPQSQVMKKFDKWK